MLSPLSKCDTNWFSLWESIWKSKVPMKTTQHYFFPFFFIFKLKGFFCSFFKLEGSGATTCYLPLYLNFLTYHSPIFVLIFLSNIIFHLLQFFVISEKKKNKGVGLNQLDKKIKRASHDMTDVFEKKKWTPTFGTFIFIFWFLVTFCCIYLKYLKST